MLLQPVAARSNRLAICQGLITYVSLKKAFALPAARSGGAEHNAGRAFAPPRTARFTPTATFARFPAAADRCSAGTPGSALGANADLYIDFATGNLYRKHAGRWRVEINVRSGVGACGISEVAVTGTGLIVTNGTGPVVQLALDFGSAAGQVADGGALANTNADVATVTSAQASTAASLSAHVANTNNPHSVTKAQIGLGNVTDDEQLKRAANEFSSFAQKSEPTTGDLVLIQDQAAGGALKHSTIGSVAPAIQSALDFGLSPGQVADGGALANTNADVAAVASAQASAASALGAHVADNSNPHCVTKAQIGLGNVTDDEQLKRAANELSSFAQKSTPASSDLILIQDQSAAGALKHSTIGSLILPAHSSRDPIWDPPTVGSSDDDEFTVDGLATGAYTMYVDAAPPITCIRDGALDMTAAPAANHYRSSVIGSTLYVQIPNGAAFMMTKPFAGALSTQQWWMLGIGCAGEPTGNTNNPRAGLYFFKQAGSLPDQTNRGGVRMIQSVSRFEAFGTVAGASNISATGGLGDPSGWSADGIVACVKHGSAAAQNFSGFAFKRGGQLLAIPAATTPQYNSATDYVGIYLLSNLANLPVPGVNSTLFAIHFLRRIPVAPGNWIAQP